jgi:hypothetical protein
VRAGSYPITRKVAGRDMRRHHQRRREHRSIPPAEQIGHRRTSAAIRHVQHLDAGHLGKQLRPERCEAEPAPDEPNDSLPGLAFA